MKNKNQTNPDQKPVPASHNNHVSEHETADQTTDPILASLDALYAAGPPPGLIDRAINKLRRSLPDTEPVYYQSLKDTPLGDLFVAVGDQGLMAVDFGIPESKGEGIERNQP